MATTNPMRLAVLIDADNATASLTTKLLAEIAKYGTPTIKRAYGDWTTQQLVGWKEELLRHAIQPVQQFAYTRGKNSTDSALIIDAMDLLYAGSLEGFVLVSSDSDFTRLATRLRESGMIVFGLGRRDTPAPFVAACDRFIYLDLLSSEPLELAQLASTDDQPTTPPPNLKRVLSAAISSTSKDDGWSNLSEVGSYLSTSAVVKSDHRRPLRADRGSAKSVNSRHDPRPRALQGWPEHQPKGQRMSTTNVADSGPAGFEGRLIWPQDDEYEQARTVYNASIDKRPAVIARCAGASDVARAIAFARERDLPLAVRGGGHNGAGLGTCEDGLVLDLSPMKGVQVDPEARTARVGGGCTLAELDRATHAHGLATPSGIISTTGVGGITLGGGLGYLTRSCGLAIDNLLAADVVLANGEQVRASADEHPDLFWAIRGGGGNFGVVCAFEFRLHEVDTVIAGPTFWPVELGAEVLSVYRDFLPAAPRELYGFFAFATVPPADPFPAAIHGRKVCGIVWHHRGSQEEAARAMAPLLDALPEPLLHGVQPVPHPAMQSAFDGLYPPGDQWYWRADFVKEIPDAAVDLHARFGAELPTMKSTMHLYPVDGAAQDAAPADTAWSYRDATWATVYAGVDPDPANAELIRGWTVDYQEALHPYSAGGAYVNMMMDEGPDRVRASYRDNYDRLARIKATYDPDNTFRINQNIVPSDSRG